MTWFKVDDSFHSHRKTMRLTRMDDGLASIGLWNVCGSWSSSQLADGFIPDYVVESFAPTVWLKRAEQLTNVGLWEVTSINGDDGWQFHDWLDWQPSAAKIVSDRRQASLRQSLLRNTSLREMVRRRDADRCRYCGKAVKWTDRVSTHGGTFDIVDPAAGNMAENIVVTCRGCFAIKDGRTALQAGLVLQNPQDPVTSYYLDSSRPPTRPPLKGVGEGARDLHPPADEDINQTAMRPYDRETLLRQISEGSKKARRQRG